MPSVYPVHWVPTTFRGAFPHFAKRDAPVWDRFLELYADRWSAFAYDVALGGLALPSVGASEAERLGWQYSTALKVDACGLAADAVWLFEVRPEATVSALGAVLTYTLVAERDTVFAEPLLSAVVCESMQADVKWCCDRLGVRVFYV
jgi:hypothetical protein